MPDWSYRTVLRPMLHTLGPERARRVATATLRAVMRLPFGGRVIDFLGHMRADPRLRTPFGPTSLAGPVALAALVDPAGEAVAALERFGVGMIEVGPVALEGDGPRERSGQIRVGVEEVARNLARAQVPVCVRIAATDAESVRRIVERLQHRAALFALEDRSTIAAARGERPVLVLAEPDEAAEAMRAGADGVWLRDATNDDVRALRTTFPDALIVAGDVHEPADARRLLDAGANVVAISDGLACSGPGLAKRCNEALLASMPSSAPPEPLTLDAARRSWFWGFLLGVAMFAGGLLAIAIASTRVVLPYDERLSGSSRAQLDALNPHLLPFMAHDRVSLAGTMISIGIFYAALAWCGIRRGEHWAHVTLIVSAMVGFFSFFFFLGFGYFDPFHAFVTAILTQFTLLCMVLPPSPQQPGVAEWHESAAWRRGQWGQLLFILIGVGLTGAGAVISYIGCTSVFVDTDLAFLRTTPERLQHLVPLIAHDRASLGGMLLANGLTVWLAAQWGFRAGARWLWLALAWGGNIAFAAAVAVHVVVGYGAILHLMPAFVGWFTWNLALALTRGWLTPRACTSPSSAPPG